MFHFGVYAIILREQNILLVRKMEGPYSQMLDLPGGGPEDGEDFESTLAREAVEEIGASVRILSNWKWLRFVVRSDSSGHPIRLTHEAVVCRAEAVSGVNLSIREQDVGGAQWFPIGSIRRAREISPLTRRALLEFNLI